MHHFKGLGEPKKKLRDELSRLKTGSKESDELTDTIWDDVDPAEFFDPEEFGIRRRDSGPFPR